MDARLRLIIQDFIRTVNVAVTHMQNHGIELQASNLDWACYQLPESVKRLKVGRASMFRKHGFGCEVTYSVNGQNQAIDFDFGTHGEIDGFDLWRLSNFVDRHAEWSSVMPLIDLELLFEQSVKAKELIGRDNLYYLCTTLDRDIRECFNT